MSNLEKVDAFLKDAGTFFYTTTDGDKPRVRPFGFYMLFKDKLYCGIGKQKQSFAQTVANPNIEVCAMNAKRQWIRIRGTAVVDDSAEALEAAFAKGPFLKTLYNEQTGNKLGIVAVENGYAEIADMAGGFESFEF